MTPGCVGAVVSRGACVLAETADDRGDSAPATIAEIRYV